MNSAHHVPVDNRQLLTDVELSAYLGIKVGTLRKWRITGQGVPWIKVNGSLVRYRLSDIDAYLNSCPRGGAAGQPADLCSESS